MNPQKEITTEPKKKKVWSTPTLTIMSGSEEINAKSKNWDREKYFPMAAPSRQFYVS